MKHVEHSFPFVAIFTLEKSDDHVIILAGVVLKIVYSIGQEG